MSKLQHLFQPLSVGKITIKNRFVMAPLTRTRADLDHIPKEPMVKHYADRASFGLIIAEATMAKDGYSTFAREPGIYNEDQVAGWKKVTDAVHGNGGHIYLQIHHGGRSTLQENLKEGLQVESCTTQGIQKHGTVFTMSGEKKPYPPEVHALTIPEIKAIVQCFVQAAKNAMKAGFDGVQVHGANGYLLDQFIKDSCNTRTDEYGGSIPNRCRLLLEIVDGVIQAIGKENVAVRLSPLNTYNEAVDSNPEETTKYLCQELSKREIAFLDVLRADFFTATDGVADKWAREHFKGLLFSGVGIGPEEAEKYVAEKRADAICFGKLAMANPDLPERVRRGVPLNELRMEKLYGTTEEGYNDYPKCPQE